MITGVLTLLGVLASNCRSQAVKETRLEIRVMDRRIVTLEKLKD